MTHATIYYVNYFVKTKRVFNVKCSECKMVDDINFARVYISYCTTQHIYVSSQAKWSMACPSLCLVLVEQEMPSLTCVGLSSSNTTTTTLSASDRQTNFRIRGDLKAKTVRTVDQYQIFFSLNYLNYF